MPGFLTPDVADAMFVTLRDSLAWVRHDNTPRSEYYVHERAEPYTYGTPPFERTYRAQPWTDALWELQDLAEKAAGRRFQVCFLNRYHNQTDQLGWHADNSPEMDDDCPIAIISLGVEREIMFREDRTGNPLRKYTTPHETTRLKLEHGSLCLMHAGMQDTHQHRIPKAGFMCGERISLTFRRFAKP